MATSFIQFVTGFIYSESKDPLIFILGGIFGVITVTGADIGPFRSIEKGALA
jgi:hypothetical protein